MTITIYSKSQCPNCEIAKTLLKSMSIAFTEVRVDLDPESKQFLIGQGHKSVPQFYRGDELLLSGGYQELVGLSNDELKIKFGEKTC